MRPRDLVFFAFLLILLAASAGCGSSGGNAGGREGDSKDPHVVPNKEDYEENPKFISPPTLAHPIYECSRNVTIKDFVKDAKLNVFINGAPAPNPTVVGQIPELGVNFDVGLDFTAGQVVHVTQTVGAVTSGPSNAVPVTSHTADYPAGLPRPRLWKHPLFQCGHAILVEDVVPGSKVEIFAENPDGMGGFKPAVLAGDFLASTEWGWNWTGVSPEFELGARITARASLCKDVSAPSEAEITEPAPSPMPAGSIEPPVIEGQEIVRIWGAGGPGDPPQHGAILAVFRSGSPLGSTPSPGGAPHLFGIPPATLGGSYTATQKLCKETPPGTGPETPTQPCSDLPAPKIKPPLPGDTKIYVTEHIPGANILVFAGAEEIGDSSGNVINLSRPINNGEIIKVMQKLGKCVSPFRYEIAVACDGDPDKACSGEWPEFRHNGLRNARQIAVSPLGDPYAVKTLKVKKDIAAPDGGSFTASPVIFNGKVYIGTSKGHLFAFDAMTLAQLWQFPPPGDPPLLSDYNTTPGTCANPSSGGIAASVAIAQLKEGSAVILGAPDKGRPSDPGGKFAAGIGSGRLFALNPNTGAVIWMSAEIARMTGTTSNSTSQFHEQIGYSSPLVLGNRIYVGIADHCDNPIQKGRVIAVDKQTGAAIGGFSFNSTSSRGGGVWTYISGGLGDALVTTTGNTRSGNPSEPATNNGLSMVRLDPTTGTLQGKIQPVPFDLDDDPDWSAGATLVAAQCGNVSVSTMKDGWSYGANLGPPLAFRWQYPSVAFPFPTSDPNDHGDIRYHRAGAAWNDLYFTMTGGEDIVDVADELETFAGYQRLHALNVCSGGVSWIADLAPFTNTVTDRHSWALGPPTVTHGIVYVGTNRGFLVAVADPSVWPAMGSRCTESHFTGADCIANGYAIVPQPAILRSMDLGAGRIVRTEPAIANGNLYVATEDGRLFRIASEASP
jgi:outer membrane protein assembly factor BamB